MGFMLRPLVLLLFLCALPARAGLDDFQRAREALERGEVLPLGTILSIVEKEIDARVIEVEFEEEGGQYIYEFELITPDGRLLEARADAVDRADPRRSRRTTRTDMRALVVEDDPRIRRDLGAALGAAGFRVESATDGEEAWFRGDTEDYDLIVLDLGLPKMDGLAVLKRWRAAGRDTPVIVLTARGAWTERVEGIDAGADDYLPKPFQMEELVARARGLVRRVGRPGEPDPRGRRAGDRRQPDDRDPRRGAAGAVAARVPAARLPGAAPRPGGAADRAARASLRRRRRPRGERARGAGHAAAPQARAGIVGTRRGFGYFLETTRDAVARAIAS